jgi:hypothetical protein
MATAETPVEKKVAVKEMSWDPVTRIVGSLGIHTEIDFENREVRHLHEGHRPARRPLHHEPDLRHLR